jgi:hypothetical protein
MTGVDADTGHHGPAAPGTPRAVRRLSPDRLAELEEERAFLLRSLRDLEREHDAGELDDADYETLRDSYTKRAADVLRSIDSGKAALPPKRRRPWWQVAVVVTVVAGLAVGSGVLVAAFSGQRLPGGTATGDIAESTNTLLAEARSLLAVDPVGAIERYQRVLDVQPDNPEALTYLGWLRIRVGADATSRGLAEGDELVARGEANLDRAIELSPGYADPHCFKAITRFRYYSDAEAARQSIDTCLGANPPQVVRSQVETLRGEIDAALAAPTTSP